MIRVLLVDDEPLVLIGMRSMLDWAALGYELAGTARNGGEALEKIRELHPDIVVSDIRMPVLDGLQLAARVYGLLDELAGDDGGPVLLVAHNGIARAVQSYFYEMTNEEFALFGIGNCQLVKYTYEGQERG